MHIQGSLCEVNSPCKNGASCFMNGENFVCLCTNQYEGKFCEYGNFESELCITKKQLFKPFFLAIEKGCNSNPCLNGLSCFSKGNGTFYCSSKYLSIFFISFKNFKLVLL